MTVMQQIRSDSAAKNTLVHGVETALVWAAGKAGQAYATWRGLSATTVGEATNTVAFITAGCMLMCCTNIGWWLLGEWSEQVTTAALYVAEHW